MILRVQEWIPVESNRLVCYPSCSKLVRDCLRNHNDDLHRGGECQSRRVRQGGARTDHGRKDVRQRPCELKHNDDDSNSDACDPTVNRTPFSLP